VNVPVQYASLLVFSGITTACDNNQESVFLLAIGLILYAQEVLRAE